MPQRILGIDIGNWSVKGVLVERAFRAWTVNAVTEVTVANGAPETHRERQMEALQQLMLDPEMKAEVNVLAVPGEQSTLRFIELPFSETKKVDATMEGELADILPFDVYESVHDHEIQEKREDGSSMSLAVAAPQDVVEALLTELQDNGVDPRFLPVDALQLHNLYTHFLAEDASRATAPLEPSNDASTFIAPSPDGPPDSRLIVDLGHDRTSVLAAFEGGIAHARVLRVGGREVTEAIARTYQIDWEDAEAGKHEDAFVASSRHPAPSDAAQRMSDVVAQGLKPLVKELRRTIQSIRREKRVRVARIDLVGGGSRIRNLAPYLAEQLNVPVALGLAVDQAVERMVGSTRRAAFALPLALALRAGGDQTVSRLDLRQGELSYAGQLQGLKARLPWLGIAAAALMGLAIVNAVAQYRAVGQREAAIDEQFCVITDEVVGRRICEPSVAISVLEEPATELGTFKLPDKSAFRMAAEISKLVPTELTAKIRKMEIRPDRARLEGETTNYDSVDQLVAALTADACIENIKKGGLRKKGDGSGVEFQLTMTLRCSQ